MSNKHNKVRKGLAFATCLLPIGFALSSCSDWDDHYDANASSYGTSDKTLWENISQNSDLSDFASVLKSHGYDQLLSGDEKFTVWAPLNGTFSLDSLNNEGETRSLTQFLQNHIAHNAYVASGSINERIYAMNSKSLTFVGNGSYTANGVQVVSANLANSNGVLHTLSDHLIFRQNIYESLNNDEYAIDSVADFIHKYDVKELDESKSTKGPVVNGEQTYLDSIIIESNTLIPDEYNTYRSGGYNAAISTEDSNYTMIIPTNEAWIKAKNILNPLYTFAQEYAYNNEVTEANVPSTSRVQTITTNEKVVLDDVQAYHDSIVIENIMSPLFYNNNLEYNRSFDNLAEGQTLDADSIISTTYVEMYREDAASLLVGAKRVDKSNGAIWITDSLRLRPWILWNPKQEIEAEFSGNQMGVFNALSESVTVTSSNRNTSVPGRVSRNGFAMFEPTSSGGNPNVAITLGNVRNTTYNIYVVVVPGNITNANTTPLPNIFRASVGYNDVDGSLKERRLTSRVESDASKVDTVFLGEFTFPVCYVGIDDAYPYLRIQGNVTPSTAADHDRTLRIDKVMLIPQDMDEYIKAHPDYKYESEY